MGLLEHWRHPEYEIVETRNRDDRCGRIEVLHNHRNPGENHKKGQKNEAGPGVRDLPEAVMLEFYLHWWLIRKAPDILRSPHLQEEREQDESGHPPDNVHQSEILIISPIELNT